MDENNQVFMNATEMAKPFPGKRISNFTRNKSVLEYVNALHAEKSKMLIRVLADSELVKSTWGGNDSGTWFQEDLALEFARWLNPKFSIWCNQRIKEILNQGFSALTPEATEYIEDEIGEEVRLLNAVVDAVQSGLKRLYRKVPALQFPISYSEQQALKK